MAETVAISTNADINTSNDLAFVYVNPFAVYMYKQDGNETSAS